jgi:hypothetical protein
MDGVERMSDADLDRLLAGKAPAGPEDVEDLKSYFRDLKTRYVADPPPAIREAHLTQIMNAARLHTQHMAPAPGPSRDTGRGRRPQWRRKIVFSSLFGSLIGKLVLAGVVAATAATGGLAATGTLPAPVQNAVAGAAGGVGINIPNPQASAAASLAAVQTQAQTAVTKVQSLVQQVTGAATKPSSFGATAVLGAQTCGLNVTTLASQLAGSIGQATSPAAIKSFAERAAALAQEAVGCGLPTTAAATATVHAKLGAGDKEGDDEAADGAFAKAISGAIAGCSDQLTAQIQKLVQGALAAKSSNQFQTLAQDAKALADAVQGCAQGVVSAIKGALASLPNFTNLPAGKLPKIPTSTATNPLSGLLSQLPNIGKLPVPLPTNIPIPSASASASAQQWWQVFLSKNPSWSGGGNVTATTGNNWAGVTGNWSSSGSWNPYTQPGTHSGPGGDSGPQSHTHSNSNSNSSSSESHD